MTGSKWRAWAAALPVLFTLLAAVPAGAGPTTRIRHYEGETSQGQILRLAVAVRGDVVRLRELYVEGSIACEDGTGSFFGSGIGFGGFSGPVVADEMLDLQEVFLDVGILVSGRLGEHRGAGTLTQAVARLDTEEQAQVCSTGELTWQVERRRTRSIARLARLALTVRADEISRSILVDPRPSARDPRNAPVRHYRGRTSAGGGMKIVIVRRDADLGLRRIGFGWHLACEDGSDLDIGVIVGWSPAMPMEPGRLDLDDVFGNSALHVHGDLGPHAGTGTASQAFAVLTPELDAQLCSSGEVTWDAWRTDEGHRRAGRVGTGTSLRS